MLTRCWLPPESVADLVVAALGEPVWASIRSTARLDVVDPSEPGEQPQVLGHGQPPVERGLLGDPADLAAVTLDGARVRVADPGEDREQRRLAGAVRADHGEQLAAAAAKQTSRSATRSPKLLPEVAGRRCTGRRLSGVRGSPAG